MVKAKKNSEEGVEKKSIKKERSKRKKQEEIEQDIVPRNKRRKVEEDTETAEIKHEASKPLKGRKSKRGKTPKLKPGKRDDSRHSDKESENADDTESLADNKAVTSPSQDMKYVGAHVSISGGIWKAVEEAVELGAKSFAMFLKSQRQWNSKPLQDSDALKFRQACQKHNFSPLHIVPHGSYLMNCGSPKPEILEKSRNMLVDELQRCDKLGLALFNFHPGSTCGEISVEESISLIAESINLALEKSKNVTAVIENMSRQGNTIGGKFEELQAIIDKVKDKSRVGVCLDTCHAFAAGYDISNEQGYEKMMSEFENIVGLNYLKALHINDSKGELGCHLDRHENIGKGKIGLEGFRRVMNDPRLNGLPLVLETPLGDYAREIRKLYSLCKV